MSEETKSTSKTNDLFVETVCKVVASTLESTTPFLVMGYMDMSEVKNDGPVHVKIRFHPTSAYCRMLGALPEDGQRKAMQSHDEMCVAIRDAIDVCVGVVNELFKDPDNDEPAESEAVGTDPNADAGDNNPRGDGGVEASGILPIPDTEV